MEPNKVRIPWCQRSLVRLLPYWNGHWTLQSWERTNAFRNCLSVSELWQTPSFRSTFERFPTWEDSRVHLQPEKADLLWGEWWWFWNGQRQLLSPQASCAVVHWPCWRPLAEADHLVPDTVMRIYGVSGWEGDGLFLFYQHGHAEAIIL